jgi:hypothetical protein
MTSKSGFALKSLLIGSVAAVAVSLGGGAFASVSAQSDRSAQPPVAANQCNHPGYAHFGFSDKQACQNYVAAHARANAGVGNGYGGGNNNNNHPSIIVSIGNIVNSAVNITINFVTNIFS